MPKKLTESEAWRKIAASYIAPRSPTECGLCRAINVLYEMDKTTRDTYYDMKVRLNEYLGQDIYAYANDCYGEYGIEDRVHRAMAALWMAEDAENE